MHKFCVESTSGAISISTRVIPANAIRQSLSQIDPCPGDMVEFNCTLRDSSSSSLRWTANGSTLYTFLIPGDISSPVQSNIPGYSGSLINERTSTLLATLSEIHGIINGTNIGCTSGAISANLTLNLIGMAIPH